MTVNEMFFSVEVHRRKGMCWMHVHTWLLQRVPELATFMFKSTPVSKPQTHQAAAESDDPRVYQPATTKSISHFRGKVERMVQFKDTTHPGRSISQSLGKPGCSPS